MDWKIRRPKARSDSIAFCLSFHTARSFRQSFHQALLGPTGVHWLDDPPDVSCKDRTRQHAVDDPLVSCKQKVGGFESPAS